MTLTNLRGSGLRWQLRELRLTHKALHKSNHKNQGNPAQNAGRESFQLQNAWNFSEVPSTLYEEPTLLTCSRNWEQKQMCTYLALITQISISTEGPQATAVKGCKSLIPWNFTWLQACHNCHGPSRKHAYRKGVQGEPGEVVAISVPRKCFDPEAISPQFQALSWQNWTKKQSDTSMQVALIIYSRCCFRLPVNTRFDTTCDTQHFQQEVKCNESNSQSDKSCLQTLPKAASQCREKLRQWNVAYKPHANRVNMTEPHTISSVMFHFVLHSISEPWFGRSVFASPGHLPFLKLGWKVDGSGLINYEKDWLQGDRWREDDTSNTVTITRPLRLLQVSEHVSTEK